MKMLRWKSPGVYGYKPDRWRYGSALVGIFFDKTGEAVKIYGCESK